MLLQLIGWAGTFIYLAAYVYVSRVSDYRRGLYFGGNLVGALCILAVSLGLHSWQAVVINGFWAVISVAGLLALRPRWPAPPPWMLGGVVVVAVGTSAILLFIDASLAIGLLGWSATATFCLGYCLFATEKLAPGHFFLLNAYSASAIIPQLVVDGNYPTVGLEAAWTVISLMGWRRTAAARQPKRSGSLPPDPPPLQAPPPKHRRRGGQPTPPGS